jgi:hypothetical protein
MIRKFTAVALFVMPAMLMASSFTPGEWEFEVRYTMSGVPTGVPEQTFRECLQQPVPTVFLQARSCEYLQVKQRGRTVHYRVNCFTENGTLINEGSVRYSGSNARGSSRSDLGDVAGRNSVLRYKFTGRYLGTCTQR